MNDDDEKYNEIGDTIIFTKNNIDVALHKDRITKPFLTKYEYARIIGYRAEQIADGYNPYVNTDNLYSVVDIAIKELNERKLPYIIKRPLPNGTSEYWKIEELELINNR
jgi:DNA-directed RNA polymerases I, II, and III subunit RPABC2